ncbi:ABC transporter ATP-binding protein [Rivihabitans pingtungensis]|uniref:Branched-chain amino acid transport system ATP-binding protein n=1 Tax=Rivihabitans pingtungensis TaxID=1054498 RepID=A0A318KCH5_9NEIS|nr:ABC transporter ATP-binding protein [Rivihabitans pingtungensis]PXX74580.1 branched-chain amino acid transport system ATP-binding protein [Rivihabitans pingtungensis]
MSQPPLLELEQIKVVYNQVILAVSDISLRVDAGQIVALLGANGAGKSTTLKTISGLVSAERGQLAAGAIRYQGEAITHAPAAQLAARGLVQVLEGRHCFAHLTVEENLITGALARRASRAELAADLARIYDYFPRLKTRRHSQAGYTSGGEQQMTAIGRALMARPRLVLLDEPSMGLAPRIVEEIFDIVRQLNQQEGVSFLLAEQNANLALRYADAAYIIENGRVGLAGPAAELRGRPDIQAYYLGQALAA